MKYHIEKNSVQETLVIPLFGQLVCSERFPELFSDPAARRICDSLDYDFAEKRKMMESPAGLFGALETDSERLFKGATVYIGEIFQIAISRSSACWSPATPEVIWFISLTTHNPRYYCI